MIFDNHYILNGKDCYTTWGVVFMEGTYAELLKKADQKDQYSHSWAEENGTERLLPATMVFDSRDLALPVAIFATSDTDLETKTKGFFDELTSGYVNFDVVDLNRRFKLLYISSGDTEIARGKYDVIAQLTVNMVDDYPTDNNTIPA